MPGTGAAEERHEDVTIRILTRRDPRATILADGFAKPRLCEEYTVVFQICQRVKPKRPVSRCTDESDFGILPGMLGQRSAVISLETTSDAYLGT